MAITDGKLGKMTILFYKDPEKPWKGIPFTPMYNPSTLNFSYSTDYDCRRLPVKGNLFKKFIGSNPRSLSVDLLFDGTGASPSNLAGLGIPTSIPGIGTGPINAVDALVRLFLELGYRVDSEEHRPYQMMVIWGTFVMTGVLSQADVEYTMFDNAGRPLRAKLKVTIGEKIAQKLSAAEDKLNSPDVSKSITVQAGDTLPLLCYNEYGDAELYSKIAEVNGLSNYRALKPGMELLFPPLTTLPE